HSNGYALARAVLLERARLALESVPPGLRVPLGVELLRPTRIYVRPVLGLLAKVPQAVRGMAHITGGGLPGNVPRVLPAGCRAVVRRGSWRTPPIFALIARLGGVVSNQAAAGGLARARTHGIPSVVVPHGDFPSRAAFDTRLVEVLHAHGVELVVLAGFMRLVTPVLLGAFPARVLNI